jgi:hypothetical protein
MAFMNPETYHGHFTRYNNTNEGDVLIPEVHDEHRGCVADGAKAYGIDEDDVETVFGWFVRLSASGYMDCTDWTGPFDTEEAAIAELREMYPEEETA